jgi:tRNA modification GTPase
MVRVTGPGVRSITQQLTGWSPSAGDVRRARHCTIRNGDGTVLDDAVATFFVGPHSYTGEDTLEVSCHGNPWIAEQILVRLQEVGARMAKPGEFTQRAFLNGRMDLTQAEAVMDIISAQTALALRSARAALAGELRGETERLRGMLLDVLARIEAHLDFPEEDIPPEVGADLSATIGQAQERIARMISTAQRGRILREGVSVAVAGLPNAGKSSLFNRLVRCERTIVTPIPGTTRDTVDAWLDLKGVPVRFTDTAGLRETPDPIEAEGVRRSWETVETADVVLILFDPALGWGEAEENILQRAGPDRALRVATKADLHPATPWQSGTWPVSSLTGEGLEAIEQEIHRRIWSGPERGEGWATVNARHHACFVRAVPLLQQARLGLETGIGLELVSSDVRGAVVALEDVIGAAGNEDVLDRLFSTFCIGK